MVPESRPPYRLPSGSGTSLELPPAVIARLGPQPSPSKPTSRRHPDPKACGAGDCGLSRPLITTIRVGSLTRYKTTRSAAPLQNRNEPPYEPKANETGGKYHRGELTRDGTYELRGPKDAGKIWRGTPCCELVA